MTFKYKIPRKDNNHLPFGKPQQQRGDEFLTGVVNGQKASDIEERFARALNRVKKGFVFRMPIISPRNMLGQLELDFLVIDEPHYYPVQIDGAYAHKAESKQQEDQKKDILIQAFLKKEYNAMPIKRIKGIDLETQEEANLQVQELLR